MDYLAYFSLKPDFRYFLQGAGPRSARPARFPEHKILLRISPDRGGYLMLCTRVVLLPALIIFFLV